MIPDRIRAGLVVSRWGVWVAWVLLRALHRGLVHVTSAPTDTEAPPNSLLHEE